MKVKELVKKLSMLDPNADVYCYEEGPVALEGSGPFDIVAVSPANVEMTRLEVGKVAMKFGTLDDSRQVVIIGITSDL